jgi:hypothetical protein
MDVRGQLQSGHFTCKGKSLEYKSWWALQSAYCEEHKNPACDMNQTSAAQSQPITSPSVSHTKNVNLWISFTNCTAYYTDISTALRWSKTMFYTL